MVVLRKELCALKFRQMHTKSEEYQKKLICRFLLIRMERNTHNTSILVYCSAKCLFCFKIVILKVQEVSQ